VIKGLLRCKLRQKLREVPARHGHDRKMQMVRAVRHVQPFRA
jgi:hypothetical protein